MSLYPTRISVRVRVPHKTRLLSGRGLYIVFARLIMIYIYIDHFAKRQQIWAVGYAICVDRANLLPMCIPTRVA